jgi:hypothetical protein
MAKATDAAKAEPTADPVAVGPQPLPPKNPIGPVTRQEPTEKVEKIGPTTTGAPVQSVNNPNVGIHTDDAVLKEKLAGYPLASWPENDLYGAEKQAMLDCVTGRRPTRPTGTEGLLRRLQATGTSRYNLEQFWDMLPKDRYGQRTGVDVPVAKCLDAMLQVIEEDEANPDIVVPTLDRLTYEKAQQIAKYGYWKPLVVYRPRLTGAMADEVFDPAAA